jgi:hypothetical protein
MRRANSPLEESIAKIIDEKAKDFDYTMVVGFGLIKTKGLWEFCHLSNSIIGAQIRRMDFGMV